MAIPMHQAEALQLRQQPEWHCTTGDRDPDENDRIVREYLPQINSMAQKVVMGCDAMGMTEDLVSAGVLGMLIEVFYNRERRQKRLYYLSPAAYGRKFYAQKAAA